MRLTTAERAKRLRKEILECQNDKTTSVYCFPVSEDLSHVKGLLIGPESTPYEGGCFVLDVHYSDSFPFEPPRVTFDTKIWHPNVSSENGAICLDILKKSWSPALSIKTILLSLQALLSAPEPNDPIDNEVASQMLKTPAEFIETAAQWTFLFAKVLEQDAATVSKVSHLTSTGFDERAVKLLMIVNNFDENTTAEMLLQSK